MGLKRSHLAHIMSHPMRSVRAVVLSLDLTGIMILVFKSFANAGSRMGLNGLCPRKTYHESQILACASLLFLVLSISVFAQDEDLQSTVDYKVNKMKKELNLTDSQADAIRPIIKDYLVKRARSFTGNGRTGYC